MKKFTLFTIALLMGFFGFQARAQEEDELAIYVSGPFNDYNPDGNEEWALQLLEDSDYIFRGTFNIPAGEFKFFLQYAFGNLVPATMDEPGGLPVASETDVDVLTDDTFFSGYFDMAGGLPVYWVNDSWAGGLLEVTLDFSTQEIILSADVEAPAADIWYIRGAFNGYDPNGNEEWALSTPAGEDNGFYTGTFMVPAGQFSLNFLAPSGQVFIPSSLSTENITFSNGVYNGTMDYAFDETEEAISWVYADWQGGEITVNIDANEGSLTIMTDATGEQDAVLFVSGTFNDFNPNGDYQWALYPDPDDETTFIGYIDIPEGDFKLNFQYAFGSLVPGFYNDDDLIEPSTTDVEVFEDGDSFFYGPFAGSELGNTYWEFKNWPGGTLEVMVDFMYEAVLFSMDEQVFDIWYIRGPFNDFNPAGAEEWALTPTEDNPFVYTGIFNIPADEFEINLVNPYGYIYVPYDMDTYMGETVEVEFTDNVFTGFTDFAWSDEEEDCYWKVSDWKGGQVQVSIDLGEATVTITDLSGESGITTLGGENNGEEVIYNLQGVRVDRNRIEKGIYIVNGKKVVIQ